MKEKYLTACFDDEQDLLQVVKDLCSQKFVIADVFTPFPVHGLDDVLGYKRTLIPTVGFVCGVIGALVAFGFQVWCFVVDYPLLIGGKPYMSIPSFIPITFELTVLFAALGMVLAFFLSSHLGPGARNRIYDERTTDDRFLVIVDLKGESVGDRLLKAQEILTKFGGKDICLKPFESDSIKEKF